MRLRSAVPQILPKSSRSPRLPFYKNHHLLTRSESTLLQLLIPLHFNSRRCNTYKKTGRGVPPLSSKVLQLGTTHPSPNCTRPCRRNPFPLIRLRTLSVTQGVYPASSSLPTQTLPSFSTSSKHPTHSTARNLFPFMRLLHSSLYTRGVVFAHSYLASFSTPFTSSTILCSLPSRGPHDR